MADPYLNSLTPTQAKVIAYKLQSWPQKKIGQILNVSQPAVSKALKAAKWKVINVFVERYRQIIQQKYGTSE